MSAQLRTRSLPRGLKNNNPLNIRIGNTWLGEMPNPTDNEFEQFVSVRYGLRAAFCILRRYIVRYRLNTIRLVISRWAPSSENFTEKYIDTVSRRMAYPPDAVLDFRNRKQMCDLVEAMAFVECGRAINYSDIEAGYSLA